MGTIRQETRIFVGKVRRLFAVHFRKGYVARQLDNRQGGCHQCGTCCHFTIGCPMLTRDHLCRVYGKCRPKACRVFPIDQEDINDVSRCGGVCGYGFADPVGAETTGSPPGPEPGPGSRKTSETGAASGTKPAGRGRCA